MLFIPGGWNGFEYWMAMTPLAFFNESLENPSILASHDGETWVVPNGLINPIDIASGVFYHSDVDLVLEDDIMYCFYRITDRNGGEDGTTPLVRSSTDGIHWSPKSVVSSEDSWTSLAICVVDGVWHGFYMQTIGGIRGIAHRTGPSATGPWSANTQGTLINMPSGLTVWHLDVVRHGGRWLMCMTTSPFGVLVLATSLDAVSWYASAIVLDTNVYEWDNDSTYRPSFFVLGDYAHIYYGGQTIPIPPEDHVSWWIGKARPMRLNRFPDPPP